ncbi:uncharacterized protein [Ptychodera flava]|uniref:uncharacterized protein n=1 Tax=Ptychodera flava TaxID=63121 RepID=UPI00396A2A20
MGLNGLPSVCFLVAVSLHYSWLANFVWMALISFDICRTINVTTLALSATSKPIETTVFFN